MEMVMMMTMTTTTMMEMVMMMTMATTTMRARVGGAWGTAFRYLRAAEERTWTTANSSSWQARVRANIRGSGANLRWRAT